VWADNRTKLIQVHLIYHCATNALVDRHVDETSFDEIIPYVNVHVLQTPYSPKLDDLVV
jgi:hypothetical protein